MKNTESLMNGLKTAGVVAGLSVGTYLSSNVNESVLGQQDSSVISYNTEQTLNKNSSYRVSKKMAGIMGNLQIEYRNANREIAIKAAKKYITKHIADSILRNNMLRTLDNPGVDYPMFVELYDGSDILFDTNEDNFAYNTDEARWFKDLMLYLDGKYTDSQLLNSTFFDTIKDTKARALFARNTKEIERYSSVAARAYTKTMSLKSNTWNECVSEYKQSKQR